MQEGTAGGLAFTSQNPPRTASDSLVHTFSKVYTEDEAHNAVHKSKIVSMAVAKYAGSSSSSSPGVDMMAKGEEEKHQGIHVEDANKVNNMRLREPLSIKTPSTNIISLDIDAAAEDSGVAPENAEGSEERAVGIESYPSDRSEMTAKSANSSNWHSELVQIGKTANLDEESSNRWKIKGKKNKKNKMNANLTISEQESSVCNSNMCKNIQTYTHETHENSEALKSDESQDNFLRNFPPSK